MATDSTKAVAAELHDFGLHGLAADLLNGKCSLDHVIERLEDRVEGGWQLPGPGITQRIPLSSLSEAAKRYREISSSTCPAVPKSSTERKVSA